MRRTNKRPLAAGLIALGLFSSGLALAAKGLDTIHLRAGGEVRGTIVTEDPKKGVTIKLPDGKTRKLRAAEIEKIDHGEEEPPPEPPKAEPPPPPPPPPAAEPPPAEPAPPPASDSSSGTEPGGPMMANLKLGPQIFLGAFGTTTFALEAEFGYAIFKGGYLTVTPQFAFGTVSFVTIPAGFQYDIKVKDIGIPVDNLYLYPHLSLGVAFGLGNASGAGAAFALIPEIGVKYQITKLIHAGFEPFSTPVYIGGNGGTLTTYRLALYGGVDF